MPEAISEIDLNEIMEQRQMERSAENTAVMKIGAEGAQPLHESISPIFAQAANDPSMDMAPAQTQTLDIQSNS